MSALQWALLIIAAITVIAVYLYSRRDRRAMDRGRGSKSEEPLLPPRDEQLDIFSGGQFDEFGVGKPRRIAPTIGSPVGVSGSKTSAADPADSDAEQTARATTRVSEGQSPSNPTPREAAVVSEAPDSSSVEEKIVALLLAERGGRLIDGVRLHAALKAQGLEYGDRQIYHRLMQGNVVFSVASLVKPGYLDPAQADTFFTPGLTLFLVLPGPQQPIAAVSDMLGLARGLAKALNAQIYDAKRRPFTPEAERALLADIESWAHRNHLS